MRGPTLLLVATFFMIGARDMVHADAVLSPDTTTSEPDTTVDDNYDYAIFDDPSSTTVDPNIGGLGQVSDTTVDDGYNSAINDDPSSTTVDPNNGLGQAPDTTVDPNNGGLGQVSDTTVDDGYNSAINDDPSSTTVDPNIGAQVTDTTVDPNNGGSGQAPDTTVDTLNVQDTTIDGSGDEPTTVDPGTGTGTGTGTGPGTGTTGTGPGTGPGTGTGSVAKGRLAKLFAPPKGQQGDSFEVVSNPNSDWTKIVANDKVTYFLNPVQTKNDSYMYDPWTIGQVLGYIYERTEFGGRPPAGYTIELMGLPIPKPWKRSAKNRRGVLVFTKKDKVAEDHYWDGVLGASQE